MTGRARTAERPPEAGRFLRRRGNLQVRRERRHRSLARALTRTAVIATLVAAVALGVGFGVRWLSTTPRLGVARIEIRGARNADPATLRSLAAGAMSRNLIALDLAQVADNVGTHPWVSEVVVRRRLPDTLVIRVREHEPCALALLGDEVFLIDGAGTRIDRYGPRYAGWSFPVYRGIDGLDPRERVRRCRRASRQLRAFRDLAPELYERLAEVDLAAPDRTVLSLTSTDETLWVDPDDWTKNLDAYRAMRATLAERHGGMRHVDLRWEGRLSVLPDNPLERMEEHG